MLACGGDALIDFVPTVSADGQAAFLPRVGGSCLNVAVALARLGLPVGFVGGVSTDLFGTMIADHLTAAGVDGGWLTRSDAETTLAFVQITDGNARYAFYDEHTAGRDWIGTPGPEALAGIEALHVGSVTLINDPAAGAYEALVNALADKAVISLDPNCRPSLVRDFESYRSRIRRIAERSDIVRFSEEDLEFLYPDADEQALAGKLLESGVALLLISRGGDGASVYSAQGRADVPVAKGDVADTIGAGDTFQAGMLCALRERGRLTKEGLRAIGTDELRDCLQFAVAAAAVTVSRIGCDPPRRDEVPPAAA